MQTAHGLWAVLATASLALAQGRAPELVAPPAGTAREAGHESVFVRLLHDRKLAERLELSPTQVAALKAKAFAARQERQEWLKKLEAGALEQARLLTEPAVDEEAVLRAVEKTGAIRTELAKLELRSLLEVRKILTPEQYARVRGWIAGRLGEWRARNGVRPGERWRERREGDAPRERGPAADQPPPEEPGHPEE